MLRAAGVRRLRRPEPFPNRLPTGPPLTEPTDHPPLPEAFERLGVRPSLLRGLADMGFVEPSEIQSLVIPPALAGNDILGQARTGTGKTAAFGLPILQKVSRGAPTQALILAPTRELAMQIEAEMKRLGAHTPIRTVAVYGGQKITAQLRHLKTGPEVLVGTPGRVIDLLDRRIIDFANVRFAVLDEVDRMLDIGFRDDIQRLLHRMRPDVARRERRREEFEGVALPSRDHDLDRQDPEEAQGGGEQGSGDRAGPQTIFVSATLDHEIERLARTFMHGEVVKLVAVGADQKPTVENVEQAVVSVQPWDKYRALAALLRQEQPPLAIVFTRTKRGAEKAAHRLEQDGINCTEIHGNLNQAQRDRVMKGFRGGKFNVLVATDLASRGIDVKDVTHIINYDVPEDPEAYVHRIGRTARMGGVGKAFTFVTREQGEELTRIEDLINMLIPPATVEGFAPTPPPADWTAERPTGPRGSNRQSAPEATGQTQTKSAAIAEKKKRLGLGAKIPLRRRRR